MSAKKHGRKNGEMCAGFVKGLEKAGLDYEEVKKNWKYCGNDYSEIGAEIFDTFFQNSAERPEHEDYCICGVAIQKNCWITNGEDIITIGADCQKTWLGMYTGKICAECRSPHKNKKDNYCNDCRTWRQIEMSLYGYVKNKKCGTDECFKRAYVGDFCSQCHYKNSLANKSM